MLVIIIIEYVFIFLENLYHCDSFKNHHLFPVTFFLLLLNALAFWALTASLRVNFLPIFGSWTGAAATGSGVGFAVAFAPAAYSLADVPALATAAFLGGDAGLLVATCAFFGDEGYFFGGGLGLFWPAVAWAWSGAGTVWFFFWDAGGDLGFLRLEFDAFAAIGYFFGEFFLFNGLFGLGLLAIEAPLAMPRSLEFIFCV